MTLEPFWLCCVSSHVTTTRHACGIRRTVLYVVSYILLTQHNQENARMSPDPFPFCGWGLGMRHTVGALESVLYSESEVPLYYHGGGGGGGGSMYSKEKRKKHPHPSEIIPTLFPTADRQSSPLPLRQHPAHRDSHRTYWTTSH